ncbi:VOC family protein [Nocardioides sp. zg-1228]|uniref:VOC family protein n=1 Tax=Nocardioides sp. zg-1228 TaxID=2763008 RepID=UPI001642CB06|nr:VOC family protein [Nocardioides sp. zg-1228]MBC2935180.1 VOC family protein [Nocardioides sp. zg-1228]QSF58290.1 VOC family protein [Nocardioides sp. zg-1228]
MKSIALPIADRERSYRFYRDLGLDTPGTTADDGVPEPLVIDVQGFAVILVPTDGFRYVLNGRPISPPTASECILSLELTDPSDVDSWHRTAVAVGATSISAPEARPWGYTAVVTDPDGHAWEATAADSEHPA